LQGFSVSSRRLDEPFEGARIVVVFDPA